MILYIWLKIVSIQHVSEERANTVVLYVSKHYVTKESMYKTSLCRIDQDLLMVLAKCLSRYHLYGHKQTAGTCLANYERSK